MMLTQWFAFIVLLGVTGADNPDNRGRPVTLVLRRVLNKDCQATRDCSKCPQPPPPTPLPPAMPQEVPHPQDGPLQLKSSLTNFIPKLADDLSLNCTLNLGKGTAANVSSLGNITLYKWDEEKAEYKYLAVASPRYPQAKVLTTDITDRTGKLTSNLAPNGTSYLALEWNQPTKLQSGLYMCKTSVTIEDFVSEELTVGLRVNSTVDVPALVEVADVIQRNVKDLKRDVRDLKGGSTELKNGVEDLKEQTEELKEETTELRDDVGNLEEQTNDVKTKTSELRTDMDDIKADTKELKLEANALVGETKKCKDVVGRLERENTELKDEVGILGDNITRLQESVSSLERDNTKLKDEISLLVSSNNTRLEEAIGILGKDNTELQTKLEALSRRFETLGDQDILAENFWPGGTYGLMATNQGCPRASSFKWHEGRRNHHTESSPGNINTDTVSQPNRFKNPIKTKVGSDNFLTEHFCMRLNSFGEPWPKGKYCINKRGDCPDGFASGYYSWDGEDDSEKGSDEGELPDHSSTWIYYCCRTDGDTAVPISLPTSTSFYLYRIGGTCQQVRGMSVREEFMNFDTENSSNNDSRYRPYPDGSLNPLILRLCYYSR